MDELKDKKPFETDADIEAIVRRESEDALRRFRAGDFASRLKTRLETPPLRQPFFLLRKPVFVPALGVLVLAVGALIVFHAPVRRNGRVEAGFRHLTETLAKSDLFQAGGLRFFYGGPNESTAGRNALSFATILFRAAAGSDAGSVSESAASAEGGAPLRPLFSPKERLKILYGDQAILRVLTNITTQKEV